MRRALTPLCGGLALMLTACSPDAERAQQTAVTDAAVADPIAQSGWSATQQAVLKSLSISSLPPLPLSPGNPLADDPHAVQLGHRLFFDARFSSNGEISCASCHQPSLNFKDGLPRARGIGEVSRKTMSIVGAAYSPWQFWDGRRDSLWAQALVPLEHPLEQGLTRLQLAQLMTNDPRYRSGYEQLFGPLPDLTDAARFPPSAGPQGSPAALAAWQAMSAADRLALSRVFANTGKLLEAYQRRILPAAAPFDDYVQAVLNDDAALAAKTITLEQQAGLRLFIGKARCTQCHSGPLFTNNEFHNTGLPPPHPKPIDRGRLSGVRQLLADEFNCLGPFGAHDNTACVELRFIKSEGIELFATFRTPSLRNAADSGPFMHTGQFSTLRQVLHHYNEARPALLSDELKPLHLTPSELAQLESFLHTLSGPLAAPAELLRAP